MEHDSSGSRVVFIYIITLVAVIMLLGTGILEKIRYSPCRVELMSGGESTGVLLADTKEEESTKCSAVPEGLWFCPGGNVRVQRPEEI